VSPFPRPRSGKPVGFPDSRREDYSLSRSDMNDLGFTGIPGVPNNPELEDAVPRDALRAPVVLRHLGSKFWRQNFGHRDRIRTEHDALTEDAARPDLAESGGVVRFNQADALNPSHFAVILSGRIGILVPRALRREARAS
jgi:hypothetical protein